MKREQDKYCQQKTNKIKFHAKQNNKKKPQSIKFTKQITKKKPLSHLNWKFYRISTKRNSICKINLSWNSKLHSLNTELFA